MSDYFDRTEAHLLAAVERGMPLGSSPPLRRAAPRWQRSRRLHLALALLVIVLGLGAVAFASGLISFGAPAASVPVFAAPDHGLGRLRPESVHLLPISVPDPVGGPGWGMRVLTTTRGVGCIQVGRLLDGRLVALGQDEAFGNDGRAHVLPVSTDIQRLNCSLLDGSGRIFDNITQKSEPASAAPDYLCRPPGTYARSDGHTPATCPLSDERNLYYGLLGPDATSITYTSGGQPQTIPTTGSDGAYLIVTTGTTHRYTGAVGAAERRGLNVSGVVPEYGPITSIHYRSGAICRLQTATKWIYGPGACSPQVPEPHGWTPTVEPAQVKLASPPRVTLVRSTKGIRAISIRCRAPVAISTLGEEYAVEWHEPGGPPGLNATSYAIAERTPKARLPYLGGLIPDGENIAKGELLTSTIAAPVRPGETIKPGVWTGRITLHYSTGPLIQTEEDTARLPVATFTATVGR
jgi:hypothetical protein